MSSSCSLSSEDQESKEEEELVDVSTSSEGDVRPTREQILLLLRPLHHEQLIEMLVPFIEREPSIYLRMIREAESNVTFRKLFVHGLPLGTSEIEFRNFFECYGPIEAIELPIPRAGAEVKYGFIVFSNIESVQKALLNPNKWFGGKEICCKVFTVRPASVDTASNSVSSQPPNRKIFVSGLSLDVKYNDFLGYFAQFGAIESAQISASKGSGFVTYVQQSSAHEAIVRSNRALWHGRRITVAWYRKRPEDEPRPIGRRASFTMGTTVQWPNSSQYPTANMAGSLQSQQWYGYSYFTPDPFYYVQVPMIPQDVQLTQTVLEDQGVNKE